jgi:hypothetical protein
MDFYIQLPHVQYVIHKELSIIVIVKIVFCIMPKPMVIVVLNSKIKDLVVLVLDVVEVSSVIVDLDVVYTLIHVTLLDVMIVYLQFRKKSRNHLLS